MDATEKTYLLNVLKESENDLLQVLNDVDEALFQFKSSDKTWSMAEIVEHLIIMDTGLLQSFLKKGATLKDTTGSSIKHQKIVSNNILLTFIFQWAKLKIKQV